MAVVTGEDEMDKQRVTPAEQAFLARENAADRYASEGVFSQRVARCDFLAGWDAALAWVEEQRKAGEVKQ